jgi:predicted transcriptional regulator
MAKRGRLEIIRDILTVLMNNRGAMLPTPLLRRSNVSTARFKEYFAEIRKKGFVNVEGDKDKMVVLTEKGRRFLEKYKTIVNFIDEFEL